jgi:hypothetical protein
VIFHTKYATRKWCLNDSTPVARTREQLRRALRADPLGLGGRRSELLGQQVLLLCPRAMSIITRSREYAFTREITQHAALCGAARSLRDPAFYTPATVGA